MKNKGFTLVELLITIALIGILGVISVGIIINSVDGTKNNIDEYQKELLKGTAKLYFDDNVDTSDAENGATYNICIQENLVNEGYLEEYTDADGNLLYGMITLTAQVDSYGTITKVTSSVVEGSESNCY